MESKKVFETFIDNNIKPSPGEGMVMIFLDLYKAYDHVDLDKFDEFVKEDMRIGELSEDEGHTMLMAIDLFRKTPIQVGKKTFLRGRGIPQGSGLAPMFFNYYVHRLMCGFEKRLNVRTLAYADNFVLITTEKLVKGVFEEFSKKMEAGGIKVLEEDSVLLFVHRDLQSLSNLSAPWKGKVVEKFKHLGFHIMVKQGKLGFVVEEMVKIVGKSYNNPKLYYAPFYVRLHFLRSFVEAKWKHQTGVTSIGFDTTGRTVLRQKIRWAVTKHVRVCNLSYVDMVILRLDPIYLACRLLKGWTKLSRIDDENEVLRNLIYETFASFASESVAKSIGFHFGDDLRTEVLRTEPKNLESLVESIWSAIWCKAVGKRRGNVFAAFADDLIVELGHLFKYRSFWIIFLGKEIVWAKWQDERFGRDLVEKLRVVDLTVQRSILSWLSILSKDITLVEKGRDPKGYLEYVLLHQGIEGKKKLLGYLNENLKSFDFLLELPKTKGSTLEKKLMVEDYFREKEHWIHEFEDSEIASFLKGLDEHSDPMETELGHGLLSGVT